MQLIREVAVSVPFESSEFIAQNVQDAIIEAKHTALGAIRYVVFCGFDGSAGNGRWLEWSKSVPSNTSPYVVAKSATIKEISISCNGNATATITFFKNAVSVATMSLSAQETKYDFFNVLFNQGDALSAQVTSGSLSKPAVFINFQVG